MAIQQAHKFKIKKEDTVQVMSGREKGKRGRILKIIRDKDRVVIEGINLVKKAQKKRKQQDRGGIVEIEAAIHSSNVALVCKKCGPTRVGYKMVTGADSKVVKTRICKKCGEAL
ncbi:MAG: 50S ribosomal protein L24 [Treponema sp.]|nr:50S ribosomal protein L24 [Treponema sp.]